MCGIAGVLSFAKGKPVDKTVLQKMRETMVHRGPDGGDEWIDSDQKVGLAFRRLAIVDLSTTALQPMSDALGKIWVVFNGEIYNHLSLRKELKEKGYIFKTDHSDTEVLVHGYIEWGIEGLLSRIEGDFGIGIWDSYKKKLFLIRDRIGVKPLYFSFQQNCFLFASEIKAILAHPEVVRDIDPIAMYHYLSFLTTPAPFTMFQGIFKLPAGHYAVVDLDGNFETFRYWDVTAKWGKDIPSFSSSREEESFYISGVQSRLKEAVKKRMMADVPIGVFLSGGIDSSTNVALMTDLMDRPVDTFTVGFKDYEHLNELEHADQIAQKFQTNHHQILIDRRDMEECLPDLIHHQDEPIADWVCIPLHFVSKLAKDSGVTVVQVGEGADEQFCGYKSYMAFLLLYQYGWRPYQMLPQGLQNLGASICKRAADIKPAWDVYADIVDRAAKNRDLFWSGAHVFSDRMKKELVSGTLSTLVHPTIMKSGILPETYLGMDTFSVIESFGNTLQKIAPHHDILTRMTYNEFKLRLPELLLMRVDKITMAHSLEARVPFLDHNLVEFSMNIPMSWKTRGKTPKYILKKAVEGLIPDNIIYRKKMGFGAPMSQWLKTDFGDFVIDRLLDSNLLKRGYFKKEYIQKLYEDHKNEKRENSLYIWTLFNLVIWYEYWIEGKHLA